MAAFTHAPISLPEHQVGGFVLPQLAGFSTPFKLDIMVEPEMTPKEPKMPPGNDESPANALLPFTV